MPQMTLGGAKGSQREETHIHSPFLASHNEASHNLMVTQPPSPIETSQSVTSLAFLYHPKITCYSLLGKRTYIRGL